MTKPTVAAEECVALALACTRRFSSTTIAIDGESIEPRSSTTSRRGRTGKQVLRKLLYREAPRALFERPKAGFGIPVGEWLRGPLRDWAEDLLDPQAIRREGWFDPDSVAARWRAHLAGSRDSSQALWAILMFQAWLREQKSVSAAAA